MSVYHTFFAHTIRIKMAHALLAIVVRVELMLMPSLNHVIIALIIAFHVQPAQHALNVELI